MDYNIRFTDDNRVVIIETPPKFIIDVSEDFRMKLKELVDEGHFNIVIDLSKTEYMDSSGLGAIVSRISVTRSNGGDIRLASPMEFVKSLLDVTNLIQILKIYDSVDEAVASFA